MVKKGVKKSVVVPKQKSKLLIDICTDEQINIIRKLVKQGCVFIVLGSEHAYKDQFYKGLMQEMYAPTYNGACVYDSWYKFRHAYDRPFITISLNDPCNANSISSIKQLDVYRSRTIYASTEDE